MVSYVNTTASSYLQRKQWSQRSWGTCPRLLHYSRQSWDVIPEACSQSIVYTLALLWMKQWKKQYSLPWQLLGGGILMKSINLLLKWMWSGGLGWEIFKDKLQRTWLLTRLGHWDSGQCTTVWPSQCPDVSIYVQPAKSDTGSLSGPSLYPDCPLLFYSPLYLQILMVLFQMSLEVDYFTDSSANSRICASIRSCLDHWDSRWESFDCFVSSLSLLCTWLPCCSVQMESCYYSFGSILFHCCLLQLD